MGRTRFLNGLAIAMAVAIEGFSVVGNQHRINDAEKLSLDELDKLVPNATVLRDDDLWRCSFMAESDAAAFLQRMDSFGFNTVRGPDSDFVIVNEFDLEVTPYCEWIEVAQYEKGVIAWKVGSVPRTIVARQSWTPEEGSGLSFGDRRKMENLEFVRLDGSVEVYRDKTTGELVYIGRTETPVEALYETSAKLIQQHAISVGQTFHRGELKKKLLAAVASLEKVVEQHPDFARGHYYIGKGYESVGQFEKAYPALKKALELEPEGENICRGFVAICLATDRNEEALAAGTREATFFPDNVETLGNLALCYLLNQNQSAARKTIDAALRMEPNDVVNANLEQVISSVESGDRPCPQALRDIEGKQLSSKVRRLWNRLLSFFIK